MAHLAYGQVSDKTQRVKAFIDVVSDCGNKSDLSIDDIHALVELYEEQYSDLEDVFVDTTAQLLKEIKADGVINDDEKFKLRSIASMLDNPIIDTMSPDFAGKNFVLTGDFSLEGGKETAREMIEAEGGKVTSGVSGRTNYVVVGAEGNQAWAYGSYGTKVKDAIELKLAKGNPIEIVSENAFVSALKQVGAKALDSLAEKQEKYDEIWASASSVGIDFSGLTDGQQHFFDLVKAGENVYLTGLGGTGKSYILERVIKWAQAANLNVITCAPTGIAALNVGGTTIHRALNIMPDKTLHMHPSIKVDAAIEACDLMIIDEISMCRMDLFDYLSEVLKTAGASRVKEDKALCQLIVVGDFCQLPPVMSNEVKTILDAKYGCDVGGGYAFQGAEWASWHFKKVELTEAIRQRDIHFVAALNACRAGDKRGTHWIAEHAAKEPLPDSIKLCGTNKQVRTENNKMLAAIDAEQFCYVADVDGEVTDKDKPTNDELLLKPGARVMALVNAENEAYMNGSLGTVISCEERGAVVQFDNSNTAFVGFHEWKITRPTLVNGRTEMEVIGTFCQVPLKLAWAITIHKSQGQTFDRAIVYPRCWDPGQLYTALSRLTNIDGLYLAHPINDDFLKTSKDVIEFLETEQLNDNYD